MQVVVTRKVIVMQRKPWVILLRKQVIVRKVRLKMIARIPNRSGTILRHLLIMARLSRTILMIKLRIPYRLRIAMINTLFPKSTNSLLKKIRSTKMAYPLTLTFKIKRYNIVTPKLLRIKVITPRHLMVSRISLLPLRRNVSLRKAVLFVRTLILLIVLPLRKTLIS